MKNQTPLPVERAVLKLGQDISLARRRRHISQASMAERVDCSVSTIKRLEKGDLRVPIYYVARTLHVLGEIKALEQLLDSSRDEIGLILMDEQVPKRIRTKRSVSGAM
jgi:ribosome-binding protein aMBF1 (putative translation factor)